MSHTSHTMESPRPSPGRMVRYCVKDADGRPALRVGIVCEAFDTNVCGVSLREVSLHVLLAPGDILPGERFVADCLAGGPSYLAFVDRSSEGRSDKIKPGTWHWPAREA